MDPVEVEMKVQLDFAEYEADPVFHQTVFKNDLASQLGVNASRIMITGATPGSTVFAFYISISRWEELPLRRREELPMPRLDEADL